MYKALAFQIADSIEIRNIAQVFPDIPYYQDADEMFFCLDDNKYIYVFKYGVVSFLNYDEIRIAAFIELISPFCKNVFTEKLREELQIESGARENKFGFNKVEIQTINADVIRIILLNVSQSVALDYFSEQTNRLIADTQKHTVNLESSGKIDLSGKKLKKFIGRTLNLKHKISESLYIFDSPDVTWEDENLNKIDLGLKNTFELQVRFRNLEEGLSIVKENLELFKDIMQHRNSTTLEWVVIILILVEVINLAAERIFH
jgi:uncharacterized Rmd1/YagE family protein